MKRLIITMISAALLSLQLGGCSFDYSSSESRESSAEVSYSSDDVYETIASALSEYESLTHYSAKLSQDTIDEAVRKLQHFHPEYFWLNGYTTTSTSDSTVIDFMTLNDYSSDELRTMHTELITAADSVISQIPAGSSDYDKALFVHDYIVSSTAYATEKRGLSYNGLWGNAYGCLVGGSAVCQGYAEAFSLIMQRLGIECGVCTGQSDRGSHAWNYVKIDGAYYWVDATWDDPEAEGDGGSKLRHNYFMIDDELLLRTRTLGDTQYFVPRCSTMDRNYFVMKNAYLRGYFPEEVGRVLAENADTGIAEIMFADEASFRSAVDGLFEGQEIWDLSGYAELGYTLSYSYDDKMYVLQINY